MPVPYSSTLSSAALRRLEIEASRQETEFASDLATRRFPASARARADAWFRLAGILGAPMLLLALFVLLLGAGCIVLALAGFQSEPHPHLEPWSLLPAGAALVLAASAPLFQHVAVTDAVKSTSSAEARTALAASGLNCLLALIAAATLPWVLRANAALVVAEVVVLWNALAALPAVIGARTLVRAIADGALPRP